jgi:hypothetical protein
MPWGKTRGYVLIPLLVDPDGYEEVLESESRIGYSHLSTVFEAMLAGDLELRQGVVFVAARSKMLGRPLKQEELPPIVRKAFRFPPSFSPELKIQTMNRLVMQAPTNFWGRMYGRLVVYHKRERNCNVPRHHQEDGYNLGRWVALKRQAQKGGELDAERHCRLEKINFVWDAIEEQWERMFRLLEQFKNREGHCNVPYKHEEDGSNLGAWVSTQRYQKKKGVLNTDKQTRLEEIGVAWSQLEEQWEHMFGLLEQSNDREGHCNVHQRHKEDGDNLGTWLFTQRLLKKKGGLNGDKQKRLEEIGVAWSQLEEQWEHMFRLL